MKKSMISFLLFLPIVTFGQKKATLENNVFGINIGLNPISIYDEARLTPNSSLRAEAGFGFYIASAPVGNEWGILPNISLEYKYYYNLKRRIKKGKRIDGNSGNFIAIGSIYTLSEIAGNYRYKSESAGGAMINYGARRMIGQNFNFEWAAGALIPYDGFNTNQVSVANVLMVKVGIGYIF